MPDHATNTGCRFAYQLERLYWKATACTECGSEWRREFGQLEDQIEAALSDSERSKLLRMSRSYQRLRQFST